jgi:transaldolase/glucose-6-phosphate isomerase
VLKTLERLGISLDEVTDKVLDDGVQLFADAMDKVFSAIAIKRASAATSGNAGPRHPARV